MMLEKLKNINNRLLILYVNDKEAFRRHELIKGILETEHCFMNMDIEYAYAILRDLTIPENEIKEVYEELLKI